MTFGEFRDAPHHGRASPGQVRSFQRAISHRHPARPFHSVFLSAAPRVEKTFEEISSTMSALKLRLQTRLRKGAGLAETILERIRSAHGTLTRAERQLVDTLTENYPVSGLGSITRIAEAARVSTPTVARTVRKLGFGGFPELQDALRQKLEARMSDPIKKRAY